MERGQYTSEQKGSLPTTAETPSPVLSIIMAQRETSVQEAFAELKGLDEPFELIVIEGSATPASTGARWERPGLLRIPAPSYSTRAEELNAALAHARGEFILIFDAHTRVSVSALEQLLSFAREHPEAGIVGAQCVHPNGQPVLQSYTLPTVTTLFLDKLKLQKSQDTGKPSSALSHDGAAETPITVEQIPQGCVLLRRTLVADVGQFDERILEGPLYADFCLRAKSHGWKIYHLPAVRCVLLPAKARSGRRFRKLLQRLWGTFYFFQKHSYLWRADNRDYAIIMPRAIEHTLLFFSDFIAIVGSYFLWSKIRGFLGLFTLESPAELLTTALWIFIYWFLVFMFFGLYRTWYTYSRVDEVLAVVKAVFFGVLLIFLLTMEPSDFSAPQGSRLLIISYWGLMTVAVAAGRGFLRTLQRRMLSAGIGLRRTLIIGWSEKARRLYDKIKRFPALGYRIVGFVGTKPQLKRESYDGVPVAGHIEQLRRIVESENIEEIIIALSWKQRKQVLKAISQCAEKDVRLNIIADLYGVVVGRARTNQIYGIPLIEILPDHMAPWERKTKRLIDVTVSAAVLLLGMPLWVLIALLIRLDSPGPVLYAQERVGMRGRIFRILKFRSMVQDAEKLSGPTWADKDDPRVTRVGKWLRKTRLDEIPQFWNVMKGEMSLVGPRPERPYFVERLRKEVPLYTRRLRVRPGISGWAQIKGAYDSSIEDVRQKVQYDIFYLENMSLRLDLKILLMTLYVVLRGKGQ